MIINKESVDRFMNTNEAHENKGTSLINLPCTAEMMHLLEPVDEIQEEASMHAPLLQETQAAMPDTANAQENNPQDQAKAEYRSETIDENQDEKAVYSIPEAAVRDQHGDNCGEDIKKDQEGLYGRGLLYYKKFWYHKNVDINVNGELITGIPIITEHNTLQVINDKYNYFIPMDKINYICTPDGLEGIHNLEI